MSVANARARYDVKWLTDGDKQISADYLPGKDQVTTLRSVLKTSDETTFENKVSFLKLFFIESVISSQ